MSTKSRQNPEELTDDERELFERLMDDFEGDEEMTRICELVLQDSSKEADSS